MTLKKDGTAGSGRALLEDGDGEDEAARPWIRAHLFVQSTHARFWCGSQAFFFLLLRLFTTFPASSSSLSISTTASSGSFFKAPPPISSTMLAAVFSYHQNGEHRNTITQQESVPRSLPSYLIQSFRHAHISVFHRGAKSNLTEQQGGEETRKALRHLLLCSRFPRERTLEMFHYPISIACFLLLYMQQQ